VFAALSTVRAFFNVQSQTLRTQISIGLLNSHAYYILAYICYNV